jgi:hypothetical protein
MKSATTSHFTMGQKLRIGLDFDNTIINYDDVFCAIARNWGLVERDFTGRKQAVRDAVRLLPGGELAWQRLQGQVYGKGISEAKMVTGVETFIRRCRAEGCEVVVVSHKTEYGHYDLDRVNLRQAALGWMTLHGLIDGIRAIPLENVYFEATREEKLNRIAALSLTHFIDDLKEVLSEVSFPPNVERILLAEDEQRATAPYMVCPSWRDVEHHLFQ